MAFYFSFIVSLPLQISGIWIKSNEVTGTLLNHNSNDVSLYSAGTLKHLWIPFNAIESIFSFLEQKLRETIFVDIFH